LRTFVKKETHLQLTSGKTRTPGNFIFLLIIFFLFPEIKFSQFGEIFSPPPIRLSSFSLFIHPFFFLLLSMVGRTKKPAANGQKPAAPPPPDEDESMDIDQMIARGDLLVRLKRPVDIKLSNNAPIELVQQPRPPSPPSSPPSPPYTHRGEPKQEEEQKFKMREIEMIKKHVVTLSAGENTIRPVWSPALNEVGHRSSQTMMMVSYLINCLMVLTQDKTSPAQLSYKVLTKNFFEHACTAAPK